MQSETGVPSSHQLKSYIASKSRLKLAARAALPADAGLLVCIYYTSAEVDDMQVKIAGPKNSYLVIEFCVYDTWNKN